MNESDDPLNDITNKIKQLEEFFLSITPVALPVAIKLPADKLTGDLWFGVYRHHCERGTRLAVKPNEENEQPKPLLESKLHIRLACCEPAVLNKLYDLLLRSRDETSKQAAQACQNIDEFLQAKRKETQS